MKAVVLLSGGLDSATCLAIALRAGWLCHCITFDYGQRHRHELQASHRIANQLGVSGFQEVKIQMPWKGSALTDNDIKVPKDSLDPNVIPVTYVPCRNTIFLSYALSYAEVLGSDDIFIGVNALDYSGYPDCRPEYIWRFEEMANKAGERWLRPGRRLRLHTPLIRKTKAEIIRTGHKLGVDYSLTHSCYDPVNGKACGHCDSCLLRRRGFNEAGLDDPTVYV